MDYKRRSKPIKINLEHFDNHHNKRHSLLLNSSSNTLIGHYLPAANLDSNRGDRMALQAGAFSGLGLAEVIAPATRIFSGNLNRWCNYPRYRRNRKMQLNHLFSAS